MISAADERHAVRDAGRYRRAGRTIGVLLLALAGWLLARGFGERGRAAASIPV
jgi:hypothetical protein